MAMKMKIGESYAQSKILEIEEIVLIIVII